MYEEEKTVAVQTMPDTQLDDLYKELGKAYYEGAFEDPLPQLLPIFNEITSLKIEMENNAKHVCPYCHEPITDDMNFCVSCGNRLK